MLTRIIKDKLNIRSKLSQIDKKTGIAGESMLRADTPREQYELISAGRKNLIINGDMRMAQRGTSSTFGQSDKGYKTVDRFEFFEQGAPTAVFDLTQESTNGPTGFPYSTKLNCTTANTSGIPASVHMYMSHRIEGQDLQQLRWGTQKALPATLSFWVKSNVLGTYVVAMRTNNGTNEDFFTAPYTVSKSGRWQYVTITIPPNSVAGIRNTNGAGLYMDFVIQSSGEYSGGAPIKKWEDTVDTDQREAGQTADVGSAVNNYWQITGIQLEVGSVATPFEHRSYDEELALCQRYYYRTAPANSYSWVAWGGYCNTTSNAIVFLQLPKRMRAVPTLGHGGNFQVADGFSVYSCTNPTLADPTQENARIDWSSSGLTVGRVAAVRNDNDATAFLEFKAEL